MVGKEIRVSFEMVACTPRMGTKEKRVRFGLWFCTSEGKREKNFRKVAKIENSEGSRSYTINSERLIIYDVKEEDKSLTRSKEMRRASTTDFTDQHGPKNKRGKREQGIERLQAMVGLRACAAGSRLRRKDQRRGAGLFSPLRCALSFTHIFWSRVRNSRCIPSAGI